MTNMASDWQHHHFTGDCDVIGGEQWRHGNGAGLVHLCVCVSALDARMSDSLLVCVSEWCAFFKMYVFCK